MDRTEFSLRAFSHRFRYVKSYVTGKEAMRLYGQRIMTVLYTRADRRPATYIRLLDFLTSHHISSSVW
jgi:hypothetical protein